MIYLIESYLDLLGGFLLGCVFCFFLIILLFGIDYIRDARQEKKEKEQDELSKGKDLIDVKVPDFLPHEEYKPKLNKNK